MCELNVLAHWNKWYFQQQSAPVAPAPSTGFVFGATPAPVAPQPQAPPAFDPNMKPTFNFSQGAATTFS